MPETSPENNERARSRCREAVQTAKSASRKWRTMRRPRNPVPPNTGTRREDMTRKYRATLGYAIIFSALPEAKRASAQARESDGSRGVMISKPALGPLCGRDRWLESGSHQRRGSCEFDHTA